MIGLLSSHNNPFLPFYANALNRYIDSPSLCLLLDPKSFTSRDIGIIHRRTQSFFLDRGSMRDSNDDLLRISSNTFTVEHTYEDMCDLVPSIGCTVVLNIGTPRKLSPNFLGLFKDGIINIHPGYLPLYRGSSAVEWALIERKQVVNTIHYMDSEYDSGPIIGHFPVPISRTDNYFNVRIKVHLHSMMLASEVVRHHIDGLISRYPSFDQSNLDFTPRMPFAEEQISQLIDYYRNGQPFEQYQNHEHLINNRLFNLVKN